MAYSKIGFHAGVGGNPTGIGDYMRRLDAAGIPFCVKGADGAGVVFEAAMIARASGVAHQIIYRQTKPGSLPDDHPDMSLTPAAAARQLWTAVLSTMPPELVEFKDIIWLEVTNEIATNADTGAARLQWTGQFLIELADVATADGWRVALPAFNAGEPAVGHNGEPNHWLDAEGLRPFLVYASQHRDVVAISMHEGKIAAELGNMHAPPENFLPYTIGRFTALIDACAVLGIPCPDILISEWAWKFDDMPEVDAAMADVRWLAAYVAQHPAVKGVFLWNLGGGAQWANLPNKLQRLIAPITDYTLSTTFPDPEPPPPPPPEPTPEPCAGLPRLDYARTYWVAPQAADLAAWLALAEQAYADRRTVGFSYDDAGIGDLSRKTAVLWDIPQIEQQTFTDWYETHYPGTAVEFRSSNPQPPPEHLLVSPLSQRDTRWADNTLGEPGSPKTIGNWGCLLVAYTMMANFVLGESYRPDEMNEMMTYAGAFNAQFIQPGALATTFPDNFKNDGWLPHTDSRMHGRIQTYLSAGMPVPGRVDFHPETPQWDQHWVLLIGHNPRGYIMADPWTGNIDYLHEVYTNVGVLEALFYSEIDAGAEPPSYRYRGPQVDYRPVIHGPASDWMWGMPALRSMLTELAMPVKYLSNGVNADYFQAEPWHLVRVFWQPERPKTPTECWADVGGDLVRVYQRGARRFELLNEPNLPGEGLGVVWADGREFGAWLREFAQIARSQLPNAKLYYPGLSPGVPWTNQFAFTNAAWPQVRDLMQGFCLHAYTGVTGNEATAVAEIVDQVVAAQAYLDLQAPLVVSEASVNRAAPDAYRATVYREVDRRLAAVPGVEALCWYVSYWTPEMDTNEESWLGTEVPRLYRGA